MADTVSTRRPTSDEIREAIRVVEDPEIGISIVDLGLVYDIVNDAGDVRVSMTLTTPFCPIGPAIATQIETVAGEMPGVKSAKVEFVWTPPWDPRKMASDEAKDMLGIW